jgi:SAM-dependent methyltransferase
MQISSYYDSSYVGYEKPFTTIADRIARRVGWDCHRRKVVEQYVAGGTLLDVGSGSGYFLSQLDPQRWTLHATDLASYHPYPFPHTFHAARFDRDPLPDLQVDAITMWHVFGHLYRPAQALRQAHRLLRPGGHLFIALPNPDSWEARLYGPNWVGWDAPRHLTSYTSEALHTYLGKHGFEPVATTGDQYTGTVMALSMDLAIRARGVRSNLHRKTFVRALLTPAAGMAALLRQVPNLIYIARRVDREPNGEPRQCPAA